MFSNVLGCRSKIVIIQRRDTRWIPGKCHGMGGVIRGTGHKGCLVDAGPLRFTACQKLVSTRTVNGLETGNTCLTDT